MVFNSIKFLVFFVVVFLLYYFPLKERTKAQNWLLLIASYAFYGIAEWRMIPLLLAATVIFYILGRVIQTSNESKSSLFTILGALLGVGILLYFKYLNFFLESFSAFFDSFGLKSNWGTFNIILPLGISFFTFRLISYVVEIHRGKIDATNDFVAFATYVSFFPTIMSGPIDRPNNFIPQLQSKRSFNYKLVVDGCRQILWGLFQKMVIADKLAGIVNGVWRDIPNQTGSILFIVAILYSVQMYTDFSGYSHVAIGVGKILGFRTTKNFNYPYFSRNIAEFWRNWHISLTSWLTDYVFMPLNIKFRNLGVLGLILAIIINMVLVGMWHGANWTFLVFGFYHGLLFIPLILSGSIFKKKKLKANKLGLPNSYDFFKIIGTFLLVTFGLIIFKAENIGQAVIYLKSIFSYSFLNFSISSLRMTFDLRDGYTMLFIMVFFTVEWIQRDKQHALEAFGPMSSRIFRWIIYYTILATIGFFGGSEQQFIYFQF